MASGVLKQQVMLDHDCQGLLPNVIKAGPNGDLQGRYDITVVAPVTTPWAVWSYIMCTTIVVAQRFTLIA